jgi:threonine/homoserine/homoserine lactone efflux protein
MAGQQAAAEASVTGSFLAFIGISILVIVTPGPDTAMTVRNTLLGGRGGGLFTALGVATGQAVWALATSVGVVTLLVASEPVFNAVKLAGAAYLVFLGAQALVGAWRGTASIEIAASERPRRRLSARAGFIQGLLSDLGNPKMAVFFSSLLPQFAPQHGNVFMTLVLLGLVFCALTFAWLAFYAVAIARLGALLRRSAIRRTLDAVMGTVLIALGLRLAAEQR